MGFQIAEHLMPAGKAASHCFFSRCRGKKKRKDQLVVGGIDDQGLDPRSQQPSGKGGFKRPDFIVESRQ